MESRINPWLDNFEPDEAGTALQLLNSFVFVSEALANQLFLAGFQNLSALRRPKNASLLSVRSNWQHFFDRLIVTHVTGENPNPTDSGHIFARNARYELGFSETQIVEPAVAIKHLVAIPDRPVLFVDDFVGSGQQFIATWRRQYTIGPGASASFQQLAARRNRSGFYYCTAVATEYGLDEIKKECPGVVLSPGNLLTDRYGCFAKDSLIWPEGTQQASVEIVRKASERAGILATGGTIDWRGFHGLGLCLAFGHKTPDSTIPLFYWDQNGWQPLVRRP
jgi:hypothetical protein